MTHPSPVDHVDHVPDVDDVPDDVATTDFEPVSDQADDIAEHIAAIYDTEDVEIEPTPPGPLWNFQRLTATALFGLATLLFAAVAFLAPVLPVQIAAAVFAFALGVSTCRIVYLEIHLERGVSE